MLPPELEELIFSFAIYSDWKSAKHLGLVAKRVRQCIIPHLYEVAIFHPYKIRDGRPRFPSENLMYHGKYVHHIMFFRSAGAKRIGLNHRPDECLSWCPNVTSVALWIGSTSYEKRLIDQLHTLQFLTHLSFNFGSLAAGLSLSNRSMTFPSITHVELIGATTVVVPHEVKGHFPSLTHLAITAKGRTPMATLGDFLDCWKTQLEVFIWYFGTLGPEDLPEVLPTSRYTALDDQRLVILRYGKSYVNTWNEGVMKGLGIWQVAEETVKQRRRTAGQVKQGS
ncbi:hypothetical protein BDN72DRAFT_956846 [Pluteus cervinus]|uniref:Uncharacterized protein n=1 Tax=Pluteus cervinus TaxID=181527 RepID=A0ACD3B5X6_9AGAR|nr:hypothetical protein BDN72DRAFT_956846 [Pluteus cervinus]